MPSILRPNYFLNQLLQAEDLQLEQSYHRDMQFRHYRNLYSPGVVAGFAVTKIDAKNLTVGPGLAIDKDGQEIVVATDQQLTLTVPSTLPPNATYSLAIQYSEVDADAPVDPGTSGKRRRDLTPKIHLYGASGDSIPGDDSVILLADVTLDSGGNIGTINMKSMKFAFNKLRLYKVLSGSTTPGVDSVPAATVGTTTVAGTKSIPSNPFIKGDLDVLLADVVPLTENGEIGYDLHLQRQTTNNQLMFKAILVVSNYSNLKVDIQYRVFVLRNTLNTQP